MIQQPSKKRSTKDGTKKKPKGVSYYKKQADAYFSTYVRMRDADAKGIAPCITCNIRKHWKQLQNGHFVSRKTSLLRYDEENCNAQCYSCNVMRYGEQYLYAKALDDKYGDGTADKLMNQRHTTHKFTIDELQQIVEDSKTQIDYLTNSA